MIIKYFFFVAPFLLKSNFTVVRHTCSFTWRHCNIILKCMISCYKSSSSCISWTKWLLPLTHIPLHFSWIIFPVTLLSRVAYSSTLKMEVTCFSETSVHFQRNIRRYIPDDTNPCISVRFEIPTAVTMDNFIFLLISNLTCCSVLKMEAIFFSETSVDFHQDTPPCIPKD
jgi:hypothetical protein